LKEEPPPPFEIAIRVESDPGRPVQGAIVMKGGKEGPLTGPDGRVVLKIQGMEGESIDLGVKCPADYVSPTKPITVSLRRISGKLAEYDALCPPTLRRLVVAIRADNGPNIPVLYLGKELTRTDPNGSATLLFQLRPGEGFELALDTNERGYERIRPQNPTAAFTMKPYDDVVTFDQKFTWLARPVVYKAPPPRPVQIKPKDKGFSFP
jgi:hypothetical protein